LHCAQTAPRSPTSTTREGYFHGDGGVRLFYRVVGSGPDTVVVLHGSPGYHMNYLLPNLAPLAKGRTLLFYDQRGGGRSESIHDRELLTLQHHVRDLEELRTHFNLQRLSLIGHSWGGGLAALYAIAHPQYVQRLLLLAPMSPRREPYANMSAERFFSRLDSATWARLRAVEASLATSDDPVATCRTLMRQVIAAPLYFENEARAKRFRGDFCDAPADALRNVVFLRDAFNRSRGDWDLRAELKNLRMPTLVIQGARDAIPIEAAREWANVLPNARLLIIPDADHYLFAESPDVVIPAADTFLRGNWPKTVR
jgi:proline iminopeptidase